MSQRICHNHRVLVVCTLSYKIGNICWSCWARLVLQSSQICFDLVQVDLDLDLMRKGYVGLDVRGESCICSAVYHHSGHRISLKLLCHRRWEDDFAVHTVSCCISFWYINILAGPPCSVGQLTFTFNHRRERLCYGVERTIFEHKMNLISFSIVYLYMSQELLDPTCAIRLERHASVGRHWRAWPVDCRIWSGGWRLG